MKTLPFNLEYLIAPDVYNCFKRIQSQTYYQIYEPIGAIRSSLRQIITTNDSIVVILKEETIIVKSIEELDDLLLKRFGFIRNL